MGNTILKRKEKIIITGITSYHKYFIIGITNDNVSHFQAINVIIVNIFIII